MNKLIETAKEIDRILKSGIEILPDSPIHEKLRQALNLHDVSNNEALESSSDGVAVCPECKSKDIRPYRDHYCCYECGNYFRQTDC